MNTRTAHAESFPQTRKQKWVWKRTSLRIKEEIVYVGSVCVFVVVERIEWLPKLSTASLAMVSLLWGIAGGGARYRIGPLRDLEGGGVAHNRLAGKGEVTRRPLNPFRLCRLQR